MRRKQIKFLGFLLALLIPGCASTTRVTPVANVIESGRGGVVYALPETALDIVVPIDKNTETAPKEPYSEYTEALFGRPIEIKDKTSYAIGLPTVSASGQPDHSKVYYAQISGGPFSDSSMTLKFDARGILTSATVESENKTLEFAVSTFEAGAKIAGSAAKFIGATETDPCAKIPKPEVCAAYIRIRHALELKQNILTGPGGDVAARLAEVNDALNKDLALFFGSKTKETWSVQFRVVPRDGGVPDISLFSYYSEGGIADFNVSPRNQIKKEFLKKKAAGELRTVGVGISNIRPLVGEKLASTRLFTQEKRGLHYNMPAAATVRIYDGRTKLVTSDQIFGQFGSVGFLPVSTGSHKLHQEITLDGATGALLAVTNSSNAFDPNNINKVGNAAAGAMDAFDPKVKAERQRDIAKAKLDLLDIEKKTKELEAATSASGKVAETP